MSQELDEFLAEDRQWRIEHRKAHAEHELRKALFVGDKRAIKFWRGYLQRFD
jgi:hypothetical protein